MNTIHDMGGMDGFGAIEPEENEPVFHHRWEGRVFALTRAVGRWGRGRNWPGFRFTLESIPPGEYLRMSYYERWFHMMTSRLLGSGLITDTELETGYADPGAAPPEMLPASRSGSLGFGLLDLDVPARFSPGDRVRARNLHPRGHTRQPRINAACEDQVWRIDVGMSDYYGDDVIGWLEIQGDTVVPRTTRR